MPLILVELSFLIVFIWSIMMLVQDLQSSRKAWISVLLHVAVAIISLDYFLALSKINF